MQTKTTLRFGLILIRMAKIKTSSDSRCWQGYGERGTSLHCWDCKLVQPLWKLVWPFLRKLNIVLPEDRAIPLLGIYPEDVSTGNKDTLQYVHSSPIYNIQKLERTQMSQRGMDTENAQSSMFVALQ